MTRIKNHPYLMILSVLSLGLGLWLLFVAKAEDVLSYVYLLVGGGLVVTGLYKVLKLSDRLTKLEVVEAFLNIGIGVLIIFVSNFIIRVILGLLFVGFPLYRIFKSNNKIYTLKRELIYLIIGLVIALSGDLLSHVFIYILGGLAILLAVYLFISIFVGKMMFHKKVVRVHKRHEINRDDYIDVEYEESE